MRTTVDSVKAIICERKSLPFLRLAARQLLRLALTRSAFNRKDDEDFLKDAKIEYPGPELRIPVKIGEDVKAVAVGATIIILAVTANWAVKKMPIHVSTGHFPVTASYNETTLRSAQLDNYLSDISRLSRTTPDRPGAVCRVDPNRPLQLTFSDSRH